MVVATLKAPAVIQHAGKGLLKQIKQKRAVDPNVVFTKIFLFYFFKPQYLVLLLGVKIISFFRHRGWHVANDHCPHFNLDTPLGVPDPVNGPPTLSIELYGAPLMLSWVFVLHMESFEYDINVDCIWIGTSSTLSRPNKNRKIVTICIFLLQKDSIFPS